LPQEKSKDGGLPVPYYLQYVLAMVLALIDVLLSKEVSHTVVGVRLYRRHAGGTRFEKRHFQFSVPSLIVEVGA
jgi:hypothetical protein